jgi:hypothetical protein
MGQQHKTNQAMANELKTSHQRSSVFPRRAAFGANRQALLLRSHAVLENISM